jgi:ceramide glucosyltransferase
VLMNITLGSLAGLSLALTLWQWYVARRFPLHRRVSDFPAVSAVTLLKPLKGCDPETASCLKSWLEQDYAGPIEVLFGVASRNDPVCDVVRDLIRNYPERDIQLTICEQLLGANAKVSTLVQLQASAKHELIVVSDADVRVSPDFLRNVITLLQDLRVGLVNCFYTLANPSTWAMQWEAVAINADFWSQVLQSQTLKPLNFALGAVMATTRRHLNAVGGFSAVLDFLADDYQLGNRIKKTGAQIVISPAVVECWSPPMGFKQVWSHQLRWARTIRICQPVPYFFSILSNATFWPLLWLWSEPTFSVLGTATVCWAVRLGTAFVNHRKLSPGTARASAAWVPLAKDLLGVFIWGFAFVGNHVEWRGQRYRVKRGGRMVPSEK